MRFTHLALRTDAKAEFREYAEQRRRDLSEVAAVSIKALKLLPPDTQIALFEGREPQPIAG